MTKAAREVLLKAMGEGGGNVSLHKTSASGPKGVTYDSTACQLLACFKQGLPKQPANAGACEYMTSLCANLAVFETIQNPSAPTEVGTAEAWRWAVAMTAASDWRDCIVPYVPSLNLKDGAQQEAAASADGSAEVAALSLSVAETAVAGIDLTAVSGEAIAQTLRSLALGEVPDATAAADADEGNVCDIEFSLAFGGEYDDRYLIMKNPRKHLYKFIY